MQRRAGSSLQHMNDECHSRLRSPYCVAEAYKIKAGVGPRG
jgi:hypothetical protein